MTPSLLGQMPTTTVLLFHRERYAAPLASHTIREEITISGACSRFSLGVLYYQSKTLATSELSVVARPLV